MPCSVEMEAEKILLHEVARLANENKELAKQEDLLDKDL
jgi:hypothetical protein